jgi:hypothetical protein
MTVSVSEKAILHRIPTEAFADGDAAHFPGTKPAERRTSMKEHDWITLFDRFSPHESLQP